ncbi:MAG TPA: VOC family protein [Fimbriimonadaceae bacterium]|nr:VOC family protein [Fimbriimonadaceae bacterium]
MNRPPLDQSIVFLKTGDLEITRHFYEQVCGLELVLNQETCHIFQLCSTGFLGFCHSKTEIIRPEATIITLVTSEVESWHAHLRDQGCWLDGDPRVNPQYQILHFYTRDPNGYSVEVQKFLDPRWRAAEQVGPSR